MNFLSNTLAKLRRNNSLDGAAAKPHAEEPVTLDSLVAENQRLGAQIDAIRAKRRENKLLIDQLIAERERDAATRPGPRATLAAAELRRN